MSPTRPWFFNASAATSEFLLQKDLLFGPALATVDAGAQFGGNIVDYEHNLSFATVHGSGHMVPTYRPQAGLKLIQHVVEDTPFAPPVPSDAQILSMSEGDFDAFLDTWVVTAKTAQYV